MGWNRCLRGGVSGGGGEGVWLPSCEAQLREQVRSQGQLGNDGDWIIR